jgi:murein DD-endopeptidase / murein LD-carboxypeptidase
MDAGEIAARARRCVGARFRPQGRDPAYGLDCVGLVAFALGAREVRADYSLRGGSVQAVERELVQTGLVRVTSRVQGDVLVMRAGPGQIHLGVATATGLVHADPGLRRVVERPGEPPWSIVSIWRAGV